MFWESIFQQREEFQAFLNGLSLWKTGDWGFTPRTATIMITGNCNYKCNYCWFKKNTFPEELSKDAWKDIIDQLSVMGVQRIAFTGGEPLLYTHLQELILHARDRNIKTAIISNGSLATLTQVKSFVSSGLSGFIISLDTINEGLYANMSGTDGTVLQRVINTLLTLNKSVSCWVGMICVLSSQIIPYLASLLDFCRRHEIKIQFQPFLETDYMPGLSVPEAERAVDIINRAATAGTTILNSPAFIKSMVEFAKTRRLPHRTRCGLPFYEIYFNPDGTVKACCISDVIGDLKRSSVKEIWESEDYEQWRKKAADKVCSNCLLISHELLLQPLDKSVSPQVSELSSYEVI